MTLGKKIRYLRMKRGMTLAELADQANINLSTIKKYEGDKVLPKAPQLAAICNALQVSSVDLTPPDTFIVDGEATRQHSLSVLFNMYQHHMLNIIYNYYGEKQHRYILNPATEKYMQAAAVFTDPDGSIPHTIELKLEKSIEEDLLKLASYYDQIRFLSVKADPDNPYSDEDAQEKLEEIVLDFAMLKNDMGI